MPDLSTDRPTSYAWFVVALLVPVALLNYLDRQMLATMRSSIVNDIPTITDKAAWGLVLGCFKWTYAGLSPFGGFVADRVSRRLVIGLSLLIWSAVTLATSWVVTYQQLLIMRALMGVSEAFYIPAALAMITDFHVGSTRSRAVGLHQTGIYCGLIAGGFAGYVSESPDYGWRWMFTTCGLVGIVYSLPLLALLKNPIRSAVDAVASNTSATPAASAVVTSPVVTSADSRNPFAAPGVRDEAASSRSNAVGSLIANPDFQLLVLYFTLPAIAGWVVKDWMPAILKEKFQLGEGKAGAVATFVHPASIVGALLGGWLADRWMKQTSRGRIFVSAIGMAMFLPSLFSVGNAETYGMAAAGLILFGIGWGFFDCNNMPILCQIVRPNQRATGYGIMNLVSISCGGVADWGFGVLQDRKVPLNLIFGAFAGIAAISIIVVLLIRPEQERVPGDR